ncbi:diguanylate cyclase [Colwellia sp. BRX10-4]|jgi:diguanylate cyclase (GGDEF)-like protein|uniref:diguanylate cyclase n=1 Tax=Colwellia sp. BRX10-4 TaxID=2759843 RepID=UPI0015F5A0DB|nr:diguanylate cyclase [Colwellia sp. BRX10-4]MBA6397317.1 diguanylate cyclase [Colwellia sp. BRX10-4]
MIKHKFSFLLLLLFSFNVKANPTDLDNIIKITTDNYYNLCLENPEIEEVYDNLLLKKENLDELSRFIITSGKLQFANCSNRDSEYFFNQQFKQLTPSVKKALTSNYNYKNMLPNLIYSYQLSVGDYPFYNKNEYCDLLEELEGVSERKLTPYINLFQTVSCEKSSFLSRISDIKEILATHPKDRGLNSWGYYYIANKYYQLGLFRLDIEALEQAAKYEDSLESLYIHYSYIAIGYLRFNEFDKAREYIRLYQNAPSNLKKSHLYQIGELDILTTESFLKKDYLTTMKLFRKNLKLLDSKQSHVTITEFKYRYGRSCLEVGDINCAKKMVENILARQSTLNKNKDEKLLDFLTLYFIKINNYELAQEYFYLSESMSTQRFLTAQSSDTYNLITNLQNQSLKQSIQLSEKQVSERTNILIFSITILILISIFTYFIWSQKNIHKKQAETDELTNVYSRRYINSVAKNIMNQRRETDLSTLCVALIDIDDFKSINDTYGHDVGDEVLKKVSSITTQIIRKQDYFGRWGGEEFVILLCDTDITQAKLVMERVVSSISQTDFSPVSRSITISAGLTSLIEQKTFEELMKSADELLYSAKLNGKNKVICA